MAAFAFALAISAGVRIASLDLCADEYLLAVARDGEIAAVSRLSQDPEESASAARARRFRPYGGRIESLIPARPTLLLAVGAPGGRSTSAIARKLGWQVLTLPYPQTPDDIATNLQRVANALGAPERATPWLQAYSRLKAPARATDAVFLSGGGQSIEPSGIGANWMRLAGFRQRSLSGGRMTLEKLALDPPAVILRSNYRSGQLSLGQRWLDHPLVRKSPSRQIVTDGRPWTCGGPPMLAEIMRLRGRR